MFPARYAWLLWSLLPGFSVQENSDSPKDHKTIDKNARQIESRSITLEEARAALNRLVQNHSFLSDAPFLEPLKTRIKRENEKELLLRVPSGSAYQGFSLGYWYCNPTNNDFSYLAKSSSRTELYTIRGHFFLSEDKHWIAKITEASRTSLFNAFGKQEYEQIKPTM